MMLLRRIGHQVRTGLPFSVEVRFTGPEPEASRLTMSPGDQISVEPAAAGGIAGSSPDINTDRSLVAGNNVQVKLINISFGSDNDPVPVANVDHRNLGILILTEAISRPKGIVVAVLDIHPYLVVDDDQVVFRRRRLRPIGSQRPICAIEVIRRRLEV